MEEALKNRTFSLLKLHLENTSIMSIEEICTNLINSINENNFENTLIETIKVLNEENKKIPKNMNTEKKRFQNLLKSILSTVKNE